MKYKLILAMCVFSLLSSCSPRMKSVITAERPALPYDSEVFLVDLNAAVPSGAIALGNLTIGDTGFTVNCSFETVTEKAKLKARENGANVVKIVEHKTPNAFGSSCHRLKVVFYFLEDTAALAKNEEEPVLEDVDYALLYVYRYPGPGAMLGYNLQLGDSTICRVKNSFKEVIQIKKEGLNTLWARTESKAEVPIDVTYGKSYFLRCGVKMGAVVARPSLELVDYSSGKAEFESFEPKNSSTE